jgi:Holliday junction resolvase
MKLKRDPMRFDNLESFSEFCAARSLDFSVEAQEAFLTEVGRVLQEMLNSPDRMEGLLANEMFEHLVMELGAASVVKREDSGPVRAATELQPPDCRIALAGRTLLVEVKTTNVTPFKEKFFIKRTQFERYLKYADEMGEELLFAVYWRRLSIWTLTRASVFTRVQDRYELHAGDAFRANEMLLLGDRMLATQTPLRVRIEADATQPRDIDEHGYAGFTTAGLTLYCRDREITDAAGRNLAFFLAMYGVWQETGPYLVRTGNKVAAVECELERSAEEADPDCYVVGWLSSMHARMFRSVAVDDAGSVRRLSVQSQTGRLAKLAPRDFPFGQSNLPLWLFEIEPNRALT